MLIGTQGLKQSSISSVFSIFVIWTAVTGKKKNNQLLLQPHHHSSHWCSCTYGKLQILLVLVHMRERGRRGEGAPVESSVFPQSRVGKCRGGKNMKKPNPKCFLLAFCGKAPKFYLYNSHLTSQLVQVHSGWLNNGMFEDIYRKNLQNFDLWAPRWIWFHSG